MIFNQVDTKKNSISNECIDFNHDDFFTIDIEIKNVKRRRRKFRMTKCKKTIIKINKEFDEKEKLKFEIVMNFETEINLINYIFVKQFELIFFNVSNCEIVIINNHFLENYEIYFVQFEIQDENDVNRFFNDNFLETNLA